MAFYEPLSDVLASLRPNTLPLHNAATWRSGHDFLHRPYFAEFRQLLASGGAGVRGYHASFATQDFFASPDAALPELRNYLRLLLATAERRNEQPVLKFCRSLGRVGWMQQHFPEAVHVVVLRNPLTQFESACRQLVLNGNAYFLTMPLLLLATHRHLPTVRACLRHLGVEPPDLRDCFTHDSRMARCEASLRGGVPADWYRTFLAFWMLTATAIPETVDWLIDSDLLACSNRYGRECELELAALTGRSIEFSATRNDEPTALDGYRPGRAEMLGAHRAAEAFLVEQAGIGWCDKPMPSRIGRMLAEATSRVLGGLDSQPARHGVPITDLVSVRRAMQAEAQLAAIHASRSWKLTAPLRWLNARLAVRQDFLPHQASIR